LWLITQGPISPATTCAAQHSSSSQAAEGKQQGSRFGFCHSEDSAGPKHHTAGLNTTVMTVALPVLRSKALQQQHQFLLRIPHCALGDGHSSLSALSIGPSNLASCAMRHSAPSQRSAGGQFVPPIGLPPA
jgi:hypothetical protein